jgi:hypothetical protein
MPNYDSFFTALVIAALLFGVSILVGVALGGYLVLRASSGRSLWGEDREGDLIEEEDVYGQYAGMARPQRDAYPSVIRSEEDFAAPDVSEILMAQNERFRAQMADDTLFASRGTTTGSKAQPNGGDDAGI